MKHETSETLTLTTTHYTCDLCGHTLLAGRKDCCVICGNHVCLDVRCHGGYFLPGLVHVQTFCTRCREHWDEMYSRLEEIDTEAHAKRVAVMEEWKGRGKS
jgi:hypothetical protein